LKTTVCVRGDCFEFSALEKGKTSYEGVEMKKTMKFQSKKGNCPFQLVKKYQHIEKNTKNVKVNKNQTFPTFGKILVQTFQRNEIFKK